MHEGKAVQSTIGKINVIGDNRLTYSLVGDNSSDFKVSSDGKIKVNKPLNYSLKDTYNLTLKVDGKNDSTSIPLNINISENIAPNFITTCENSCSLEETASIGTIIINSSRTDSDEDDLTYSLDNNFGNKFSIDANTGEVKLNNSLDYEDIDSYNLKVIATDSKGITKEISSAFNVIDVGVGYSGTLLSTSQSEGISKGTIILNSSVVGRFSNPTFSISVETLNSILTVKQDK